MDGVGFAAIANDYEEVHEGCRAVCIIKRASNSEGIGGFDVDVLRVNYNWRVAVKRGPVGKVCFRSTRNIVHSKRLCVSTGWCLVEVCKCDLKRVAVDEVGLVIYN